jgi:hypothetical protein
VKDEPTAFQREQQLREKYAALECLYDWLESGKSFEELAIMIDIHAAGENWNQPTRLFFHEALRLIKESGKQGAGRGKVMSLLRSLPDERGA